MTPLVVPVEVACPARAMLGEGPLWDDFADRLRWVDIVGCKLHEYDPVTGIDQRTLLPRPVTAVGLSESGPLLLALEDRLARLGARDAAPREVNGFRAAVAEVRFNDGKVDPWGGFQVGTMHRKGTEALGSLYRLAPDLTMEERISEVTCSNGLDWCEDRRSFLHVDSVLSRVDVYSTDEATGEITGRRRVLQVPGPGIPDGLSLDSEGSIWIAMWGGGEVRRLTPDGRVDRIVKLPVTQVTSIAFGGDTLDELFITTARDGLSEGQLASEPHAGDLFWCRPGTSGRPSNRFSGELCM